MKRYTLKTIKKTKVYQANIEAVRAIYPGHEEDFARELMVAANAAEVFFDHVSLEFAFKWAKAPQGFLPWIKLYYAIGGALKGANKK